VTVTSIVSGDALAIGGGACDDLVERPSRGFFETETAVLLAVRWRASQHQIVCPACGTTIGAADSPDRTLVMTRPQDLYAVEVNRLIRVAWANPERYNAANPDDLIYATTPMPVFIADHGWYVNGVKTDDPHPDIPEDFTVGSPPEWAQPPAETSVEEPYSGPLELDGTPVKIHHTRWPVGYHRQKDVWTIIQEVIYFFGLGVVGIPWFLSKPGAEGWAYFCLFFLLVNISWLEWSSRCEDRVRVQRVAIAYNAILAAWAVHQHHEAKQREEARVIRVEHIQQQYREMHAATEARIAEMRGESTQAEANFRASQDWTR